MEDRKQPSLEDRIEQLAEAWRPKQGEKLIGTVLELSKRETEFSDEPYPLVVVLTDEGREFAVHAFHTVLKAEIARRDPKVGDRLGVKYFGRDEQKGYEIYKADVERAEPRGPEGPPPPVTETASDGDLPLGPADA